MMEKQPHEKYLFLLFLAGGIVLLICLGLLASVPPVSRDALTHHLTIPKLYLTHGGIFEIPYIEFSYYPMNLQFLYTIPLYFGNDIIPKYIHCAFGILTAILIFFYLENKLNKNWGMLGAVSFLMIPIIIKLSTTVYVDLGLIFFSTASLLQILKWRDNDFNLRYLIYASVFCGLALGTKYNGLITFFILSGLIVFVYSRSTPRNARNQMKALKYGLVFIAVTMVVFSPWLVKNFIWTGNPIFPLFDGILNFKPGLRADTAVSVTSFSDGWGHFAVRKVIYGEKWWEILLIPGRIFFQGTDNNPQYFDGVLNPFLFFLPFFVFVRKTESHGSGFSDVSIFFSFSLLFILIVFLKQDMRIRWIGPSIPPLLILSILGLKNIFDAVPQKKGGIIIAGIIFLAMSSINIDYIITQFERTKPLEYLSGKITRTGYIKRYWPEFSTIEYANQNLGPDHQILALFLGNRRYYSDHKMIFDQNLFKKIVQNSKKSEDIIDGLTQEGFTDLIINYGLFNQWAETQFSNTEKRLVMALFNQMNLTYAKDGFGLYGIKVSK